MSYGLSHFAGSAGGHAGSRAPFNLRKESSYYFNPAKGIYELNGQPVDPAVLAPTVRSGSASFFDASGTRQDAPANTPRISRDPVTGLMGLLVELNSTNHIRNPRVAGAVVGAIGGTGAAPVHWTIPNPGTSPGMNTEIVDVTRISGIDYVTVRYFGTPTANNSRIWFETALPAASDGQVWTGSLYLQHVANPVGALQTASLRLTGPGSTMDEVGLDFTLPTTIQRFTRTRTLSGGFTAVHMALRLGFNVGVPIDITVRIGLPQLEVGATASSPILPPENTIAVSTRATDVPVFGGPAFAGIYNPAAGTLFSDVGFNAPAGVAGEASILNLTSHGTASDQVRLNRNINGTVRVRYRSGDVDRAILNLSGAFDQRVSLASAWESGWQVLAANGVLSGVATAPQVPGASQLVLGVLNSSTPVVPLNGHIFCAAYAPRRLNNSALRRLRA